MCLKAYCYLASVKHLLKLSFIILFVFKKPNVKQTVLWFQRNMNAGNYNSFNNTICT